MVQNDHEVNTIIIGKVQSVDGDRLKINGNEDQTCGIIGTGKGGASNREA